MWLGCTLNSTISGMIKVVLVVQIIASFSCLVENIGVGVRRPQVYGVLFLEDYKVMMLYDYMVLVLCGLILRDKKGWLV